MAEESLVEKMLYRLIKKHIAGTTMSSALTKAEELNSKKIPASITFLSDVVDNKSKARYVTITYMELIRRISRLGLKASVHIPAEQTGLFIDEDTALKNLNEIINTGNRHGVFVWIEVQDSKSAFLDLNGNKGYGWAFPEGEAKRFLLKHRRPHSAKLLFNEHVESKHGLRTLEPMLKGTANVVLSSPPDTIIKQLGNGSKFTRTVAIEFKLGYSPKRLIKAQKKGAKVSVSVPFGKDWTRFAMNSVPESYMRFLSGRLLNEKSAPEGV